MRICTWNVNGLRAAHRKGLWKHLKRLRPDAVMLQEIRCTPAQAPPEILRQRTYKTTWNPAEKLGYSGTLTWTREEHEVLARGFDAPDTQGRILRTTSGGVELVNIYLPAGASSPEAQDRKDRWIEEFKPWR